MCQTAKRLLTGVLVGTLMVLAIVCSGTFAPPRPAEAPATDPMILAYRDALAQCRARHAQLFFPRRTPPTDVDARMEERFVDACARTRMTTAGYFR